MGRFPAASLAGAIAIALNMAALSAADLVPTTTARGGLLRLLIMLSGGISPAPPSAAFQAAFHVLVGFVMALFYAYTLEPLLRGSSWVRGALYALLVWLANAFIVLPVTGEGIAGSRNLTMAGMIWFAAAHTLFFVVLAVLYAKFRRSR
jgi:hypothetical protein